MDVQVTNQRIDHLGIIAGVIQDIDLIRKIDVLIPTDSREKITTGQAVAAMILNGLGFSDRPLSLTPQFFENKAMSLLLGEAVAPELLNRFKLGRALDDCYDYGCDRLFACLSAQICQQEGILTNYLSLDSTSFSVTGEVYEDSDEHAIEITHGYSKDHRSDLKQVVLDLLCTHDAGIPLMSKSYNG